jgi:Rod binding domain-containing protein
LADLKLNFSGTVNRANALAHCDAAANSAQEERKKKVAKDFEGVLLNKIMEEMKNSVPESGLLEDETSDQMQSLFWMYLSQDVADKGGFGLWKQIYKTMNDAQGQGISLKTTDKNP